MIGLFLCLACQFFRNFVIRYLAIYGVGVFAAYSIIHYKTPWIIISIVWPLLFVFAAGAAAKKIPRKAFYTVGFAVIGFAVGAAASYLVQPAAVRAACSLADLSARSLHDHDRGDEHEWGCGRDRPVVIRVAHWSVLCLAPGWVFTSASPHEISEAAMRMAQRIAVSLALLMSLGMAILLNYFHCSTDSEPYVYVQTYNDIYKLMNPVMRLVRSNPLNYRMVGHFIRTSTYPFPWLLGDFPNIGYYEHNNSS